MKFKNLNSLLFIGLSFLVGSNEATTTTGKTIPITRYITTSKTPTGNVSMTTITSTITISDNTLKRTEVTFLYGERSYKVTTLTVPKTLNDIYGECRHISTVKTTRPPKRRDYNTAANTGDYICNYLGDCYTAYDVVTMPSDSGRYECTAYTVENNINQIKTINVNNLRIENLCKPTATDRYSVKCSYATPTVSIEEENCEYLDKRPCLTTKEVVEVNPRGDGCNLGYEFGRYCVINEGPSNPSDPNVQIFNNNNVAVHPGNFCPSDECQPLYYYNGDMYGTNNHYSDIKVSYFKYGKIFTHSCVCNNPLKPVDVSTLKRFGGLDSYPCSSFNHFYDLIIGRECISNGGIFYYKPKEYKCQEDHFYCIMPEEPDNEEDKEYCIERNGKSYCKCYYNYSSNIEYLSMKECSKRFEEDKEIIEMDNYVPETYIQYDPTWETTKIWHSSDFTSLTNSTLSKKDPSCPNLITSLIEEKMNECSKKGGITFNYEEHPNVCDINYVCYITEPASNYNEVNKRSYDSNLPYCQVPSDSPVEKFLECNYGFSGFQYINIPPLKKHGNTKDMGVQTVTYWNDDFSRYSTTIMPSIPGKPNFIGRCTNLPSGSYKTISNISNAYKPKSTVIYDESKDQRYYTYSATTYTSLFINYYTTLTVCSLYTTANHPTTAIDNDSDVVTITVNRKTTTKVPPSIITTIEEEESSYITEIPVTTTTTTTKTLPFIPTPVSTITTETEIETETTDNQEEVNSSTINGNTCEGIIQTVTVKEKITVTEKETITVTVEIDDTSVETPKPEQCAKRWAQCGGVGYDGPTCCEEGYTCRALNNYYSQCI